MGDPRLKSIHSRRRRTILLALLVTLIAIPMNVAADNSSNPVGDEPSSSTEHWIVKMNDDHMQFSSEAGVASFLGDATQRTLGANANAFAVSFEGRTRASDGVARLMNNPAVEYVEPDVFYEYQQEFIPNDPLFDQQEWARTVNLPQAWTVSAGDPDVTVAVIDSGVRSDHPDLQGQLVQGLNYTDDRDVNPHDTDDRLGHGTAVAGIIAAAGNNETGIAGAAMNVQLMPMRVGDNGGARISRIAEAIEDAVNMGADVINLSLGSETPNSWLENRLQYAEDNDVIVVAATGNEQDKVSFPGSYSTTISVGASTLDGSGMANFSSRVSVTDLVAPGVGVRTTWYSPNEGNTYTLVQGTSFSTPVVTGTAAIVASINPDLDVHQVRSLLRGTAQATFAEGTVGTGAGLLDAGSAVREAALPALGSTWLTADEPVASLQTERTWLWGPHAYDLRVEPYSEAENGYRLVAYYDKSRMEITDPYGDRSSDWYVTNGLLVNELISGRVQVGDNDFESREPASIPVAGDPENNEGPTYASFSGLLDVDGNETGERITQTLQQDGTVGNDSELGNYEVNASELVPETGFAIADVFWTYLNSSGTLRQGGQYVDGPIFSPTFFATGFPVTDAYWSRVTVGAVEQDVLIQCFERRCLTYTPENDPGWQVEMGNVGQHYYRWRHGEEPGDAIMQNPSEYAMNNLR
jgi:thermitase